MAHLLGSQYCIESLTRDIKDIQGTLAEVGSRVGQVKYQSWKFPDKLSVDVDVDGVLEDCEFKQDEEDNQVTHVTLYDLLIDRLLFLLQSFTHFNEVLIPSKSTSPNKLSHEGGKSRSMSAGLTTRRCWSRISQIAIVMQQMAKEIEKQKKSLLKSRNVESESDNEPVKSLKVTIAPGVSVEQPISRGISHQCCQTPETLFSTCEVCSRAQQCMHDVGRSIVKVCKSQSLPTSLEDYIEKQNVSSLMSIAELTRWKNLQRKDLSRIDRQLENLMKQIKPLKHELSESAKREDELKNEIQRLSTISERREREFEEEHRRREFKLKEVEKSLRSQVTKTTNEVNKLNERNTMLTTQLSDIKDELLQKHRAMLTVENMKSQLKEEVMEGKQYQEDALKMRGELGVLRRQVEDLEEQVRISGRKLEDQKRINKTLENHEKAVQEKQGSLLLRLQELNEECEEWREKSSSWENERERMKEKVEEQRRRSKKHEMELKTVQEDIVSDEVVFMKKTISDLHLDVEDLNDELARCRERERLLVAYPDLHQTHSPMVQSSGDVMHDMQQQVAANDVRIEVLEKENKVLLKTLSKVPTSGNSPAESTSTRTDSIFSSEPVQLWKKDTDVRGESPRNYQSKLSVRTKSSYSPSKHDIGENINNKQGSGVRTSFHVGPGKRRSVTPTSRPSSARSALLKPWT
ncbi:coiled-coil domain-containing protein 157-like [Ciona intestinalis]